MWSPDSDLFGETDAELPARRPSHRGRRLVVGITVLALLGGFVAGLANVSSGPGGSSTDAFAGYVWCCQPTSISATWGVPRLKRVGDGSFGAVWVGVQGNGGSGFLQVGVDVENVNAEPLFFAFWSDKQLGFRPHDLGLVSETDVIRAELTLVAGTWHVVMTDVSAQWSRSFPVPGFAMQGQYGAEALLEDVTLLNPRRLAPMPDTTPVQLTNVTLKGRQRGVPPEAVTFVDRAGVRFYPTAFAHGSFAILRD